MPHHSIKNKKKWIIVLKLKEKYKNDLRYNNHPIVLQHGNNPGLVSHFVKLAIEYIINTQYKKNKLLKKLLKENKFNEIAKILDIKIISGLPKVKNKYFIVQIVKYVLLLLLLFLLGKYYLVK